MEIDALKRVDKELRETVAKQEIDLEKQRKQLQQLAKQLQSSREGGPRGGGTDVVPTNFDFDLRNGHGQVGHGHGMVMAQTGTNSANDAKSSNRGSLGSAGNAPGSPFLPLPQGEHGGMMSKSHGSGGFGFAPSGGMIEANLHESM